VNAPRNRHSEFRERELDLQENLVQEGIRTFGRVDVVVNNAEIMPIAPPLSRRIALLNKVWGFR
jgi:NAD(P)-dependent dehydrogenase (short-subunit alcohol dehydrogenase family)